MKAETARQMLVLQQDANERRLRLAENVGELRVRMRPQNLLMEAKEASLAELDRVTDELLEAATDLLEDSVEWASRNRTLVVGGAAALGALALAGAWYGRSGPGRKTVPLYAAYNVPEPGMMTEAADKKGDKRQSLPDVRERARRLGARAETSYEEARARAHVLAADARSRAADAQEAAREMADRAREIAGDAGDWARRQQEEKPGAAVLLGLATGLLLGVLTPSARRKR